MELLPLAWCGFLPLHGVHLQLDRLLSVFRLIAFSLQPLPPPLIWVQRESVGVGGGSAIWPSRSLSGTRQTKNDPPGQEESSRDERDAQSSAGLIFTAVRQVCGQEGSDDFVGEPGRRDEAEEAGQDEATPCSDGCVPLCSVAAPPASTFEPQSSETESEQRYYAGQDHAGPRGLQVRRQRQHRVLHGTAEDAGAVPHAVHPQSLHLRYRGHDAGPHIDAHLPVGHQGGHDSTEDAQECQGERQDLNSGGQHGSPPHLRPGQVLTADNSSAQAPASCNQKRNEN